MKINQKNDVQIVLSSELFEAIESITENKVSLSSWITETIEQAIMARIKTEKALQQTNQSSQLTSFS